MMTRMSFALLVVAFLAGCSTRYVIPQRNTSGYDYRLEAAGTNGNKQAGLKITCWRRPILIGDSTVAYRRGLSTAGWLGSIATGVALSGSGALGWSRGWAALGQYSIGLGVLLPVAAALLAPKHGEEKAPRSLLTFKPAAREGIVVQNLTRSASLSYTTGANGAASVALRDIQDWFSGQREIGIWIAPLAAEDRRIAARVTTTGSVAQVSVEDLSFEMAQFTNSVASYSSFLSQFPSSVHATEVKDSIESLQWRNACSVNTKPAYQQFEAAYPDADSVAAIPVHIERLDWDSLRTINTIESYATYLRAYPSGLFTEDVEWGEAAARNTVAACDSFLLLHQNSRFAQDAQNLRERLRAEMYRGRLGGTYPGATNLPTDLAMARVVTTADMLPTIVGDIWSAYPTLCSTYKSELQKQCFLASPQAESLRHSLETQRAALLRDACAMKIEPSEGRGLPDYDVNRGVFSVDLQELGGSMWTDHADEEMSCYQQEAAHVVNGFWFDQLPLRGPNLLGMVIEQYLDLQVSDRATALEIENKRDHLAIWVCFHLTGRTRSIQRPDWFIFSGQTDNYVETSDAVVLVFDEQTGAVLWRNR